MRLLGLIAGLARLLSFFRYRFINVLWLVILALVFACYDGATDLWQRAKEPTPTRTTIQTLPSAMPSKRYVTVYGTALYEAKMESRFLNQTPERYYILMDDRHMILFKAKDESRLQGDFTGRLEPYREEKVRTEVRKAAELADKAGVTLIADYHLNTTYLPAPSLLPGAAKLLGTFVLAVILLLMPFRKFTVFVAEGAGTGAIPDGVMLTLPATATGSFISDSGRARPGYRTGGLLRAGSGDCTISYKQEECQELMVHALTIPTPTTAEWGWDYTYGGAVPTVRAKGFQETVFVHLRKPEEARLLAEILTRR